MLLPDKEGSTGVSVELKDIFEIIVFLEIDWIEADWLIWL